MSTVFSSEWLPRPRRVTAGGTAAWSVALAAVYAVTGAAGLTWAYVGKDVTLIWPPSGICLAAMFRLGLRVWPGAWVGAFAVNLWAGSVWPVAAAVAAGNTASGVVAVWTLRRAGFRPDFARRRDVIAMLLLGSMLPSIVSAACGTTSLCVAGKVPWPAWPGVALVWWLGDAGGALTFGPPLLSLSAYTLEKYRRRYVELLALLAASVGYAATVFAVSGLIGAYHRVIMYASFALLCWAALRFGPWVTSTVTLLVAAFAALETANGVGPFAHPDARTSQLLLWTYVTLTAGTALLMNALVSERYQATRWLRAVVDAFPGLINLKDDQSRYLLVNRTQARLYGTTAGGAVGRTAAELIGPGYGTTTAGRDREVLETGRAVTYEETAPDAHGRKYAWLTTKAPLTGPGGEPVGVVTVSSDVGEMRKAQAERRKLEGRLAEAQRHEGLTHLAGGVAHDFNNLLTAILGGARGLAEGGDPARPMADIEEAVRRGSELARQLLAYAGRSEMPLLENVSLARVAAESLALAETSVSADVSVTLDCPEGDPPVRADATQIRQVFMNLVWNAADSYAGKPGLVAVRTGTADLSRGALDRLTLGPGRPAGPYSYLEVADAGRGIDAATRQRVFEPFYTTKGAGRGMGLAAVLGIVRGHGGAVELESAAGAGSRFRVYFPARVGEEAAARPARRPGAATGVRPRRGAALVIDDEPAVRRYVAAALGAGGYTVFQADAGDAGLDLAERHRGELVAAVVDMTMPGLSGAALLARLREAVPTLPLLAISGYAQGDFEPPGGAAGFAFLPKPFTPRDLIAAVGAVADTGRAVPAD